MLLDVPFALVLAILTFAAGFVPIVGAITAGALAVLVALVSQGLGTAIAVLAVVLLVQQLESNLLQPVLVGRVLELHPAVVLSAVTVGGTLFGIVGAFLAVPVVSMTVVVLRYLREVLVGGVGAPAEADPPDDVPEQPVDPTAAERRLGVTGG
ncbi:AI-2E family transporter [Quadrisphaera sp. DSM 44207]|uniref:AI-2E family transporter n=1 Tax=Quadrisphaera sp. DSM 44207 TaxID=1881057 RepID=UPI000B85390D|nr:AI-2E family transporter [Quadrisphaera sp. DSM 44207]